MPLGILWVLNSGAPWRDLPRRYGRVGTGFYRWHRSDVWQRVLEALQALADAEERVGWELHFLGVWAQTIEISGTLDNQ